MKDQVIPCHCRICNGKLRDRRTVRSHSLAYSVSSSNHSKLAAYQKSKDNGAQNIAVSVEHSTVFNPQACSSNMAGNSALCNDGDDDVDNDDDNDGDNDSDDTDYSVESDDSNNSIHDSNQDSDDDMSIGSNGGGSNGSSDENEEIDEDLKKAILRIVQSKVQYGWSQEEALQQLRNLFELTGNDMIPHRSWSLVVTFLKELGYKNPRHYKVCCGTDHVTFVETNETCPNCDMEWENCVDYYVLGLNVDSIFLSEKNIKSHLAHWEEKDQWFNKNEIDVPYKELWHGSRFRELSYFWDEDKETFLPACCPNCYNIISVEEIETSSRNPLLIEHPVNLTCSECTFAFVHKMEVMKGCPLNQAFVFHEDGFNAFAKKSRGISAIHISDACTRKEERLHGENLKVYSFIPTCQLKEGIPHKLDAFLKPLIDEITDLYMNGVDIHIPQALQIADTSVAAGNYKVKALLLLGTADIKAHQEICLYAGGGKIGCRRCLVNGIYIPCRRHYYYGKFGERYRQPCPPRTAAYHLEHGRQVDSALTAAARQSIVTATGVTGVSILFILYRLYRFDPVKDMAMDRMHLTFNMLKREFIEKMWPDLGVNAAVPVNDRNPEDGGLLHRDDFKLALEAVDWTSEEKAKGVTRLKTLTDKLGGWKSNEYKRFSSVAREVLAEKVPSKAYDCYMILCSAVQMLYCKNLQIEGWTVEHIQRLHNLMWAHAIRCEEYYGLSYCTENLEYSVHVAEEIIRHSSMDNYSCELYERAIMRHKQQKHNSKGLEKTFATRESIRNFLKSYQEENGPISSYDEDKETYSFKINEAAPPFYLHESSFTSAKLLLEDLHKTQLDASKQHAVYYGVAIGKMKRRVYPEHVISDIRSFFGRQGIHVVIPNVLTELKSIAIMNEFGEVERFNKGTTCKILSEIGQMEEWTMQVSDIILVGPIDNAFFYFVNGEYFIPLVDNGAQVLHQWCGSAKVIPRAYRRASVQPTCMIKRKVMMYPDPSSIENPQYWLTIDFKAPDITGEVCVPVYPREQETVQVIGVANQIWYGRVSEVFVDDRKAIVVWYRESRRNGVWVLTDAEDRINFTSIVYIRRVDRVFGGFRIT